MKITEIVPNIEVCRQIPKGMFEDSVFAWCFYGKEDNDPFIVERPAELLCREDHYPAPTLQEILVQMMILEKGKFPLEMLDMHDNFNPDIALRCLLKKTGEKV